MSDYKIGAELKKRTSAVGLNHTQVTESRRKYGSNAYTQQRKITVAGCVARAFINPFSIILFVLAIILFITNSLQPEGYGFGFTSVGIIIVMLLLSGMVRLFEELRAKQVADRLNVMTQTTVSVRRNSVWQKISADDLVVGDIVCIEAGERVPADIYLTDTEDLFVSQSVITGESGSFEKTAEPSKANPEKISDCTNILFQGTTVTGGAGLGIVQTVGNNTVYGGLAVDRSEQKREFDRGSGSIAHVLIKFMAVLTPIVFVAGGITKGNWIEALLFALSVAVGLTPEMLPMVINACLAKGSFQMSRNQTVVKNINAMQILGETDVLCVDKTGTLTNDTVTLEYYMDVLGNESQKVLDCAFLNSCYHSGVANPLDEAILKCRNMPKLSDYFKELYDNSILLDEQPFDYEHKYTSVLLRGDNENIHIIKGSVENVVQQCKYVEFHGQTLPVSGDVQQNVCEITDELTEDGMKVIAVAYKNTAEEIIQSDASDFTLLGYLAFFDPPKSSAAQAMERLKKLNVDIRILTGDDIKTTISVCSRLGIDTDTVLTGSELRKISENDMPICIENTKVFAELTPRQKAEVVETLQKNGHCVGFMGDGMNDIPAELKANVGISVDTAANAVKECADIILLKKDLNVLECGITEGRRAFVNMTKYIKITASSNFGNICAVVVASIFLPFLPMTSLQLLLLNLLYDILCLILPWDNVDAEQLKKPIQWNGKNLGRFMIRFGPISSAFDVLTFAFLFFVLCPTVCGGMFSELGADGQIEFITLFHTGWFLESMWTQVMILHLLRTSRIPFIESCPSYLVFWVTIAGIVLFSMFTITPVGKLLGLTPLPIQYYIFLVLDVLCYLLTISIAKSTYFKKHKELL